MFFIVLVFFGFFACVFVFVFAAVFVMPGFFKINFVTHCMPFGLNWTKRGSAVHCELPYFKIVSKHNQPWWTKVKAPPWPLAQQPSIVLLIK